MDIKWLFLVFTGALLFSISGCQTNRNVANEKAYDLRTDRTAPNYMSNRQQGYVENDITNQNPNFLNLQRTGEGVSGNNGNEIDKARQVIADTKEFVTDSVWINGNRMWVSVYKKGILSDRKRINAEARLHRKLVKALPDYNIEVRVKEDRR